MARVVRPSLFGLAAALVVAQIAPAQSDKFQEAVRAYRLGKAEDALKLFQEVLQEDPSNEQALEYWKNTDQAVWQALLLDQGEIGAIAKHMLEQATIGRRERSRDEAKIADLVAKATSGDYQQRSSAALALAADHGEFAVPALVERLGNTDDDQGQVYAIVALQRLGTDATLPLLEALESDSEVTRRNVIAVLAETRDQRAQPALAFLASQDPSDSVREASRRALAAMGLENGQAAAGLYMRAAEQYLSPTGTRGHDASGVVWSYADGKLIANDCPIALHRFEMAKKAAHEAFRIDPSDAGAKALLARAYLGEAAAIRESLAANPNDETIAAFAARIPSLEMVAAATGLPVLRQAVEASLESAVPTAEEGLHLLGQMEGATGQVSPTLQRALDSGHSRVRQAAALAMTQAYQGGPLPMDAAARVVDNLSEAVTEESLTYIKVIDADPTTARAVEADFPKGISASISDSAAEAINELNAFPNVDVVVLSDRLPDGALPEGVIGLIRKNPRLSHVKILLLTEDPEAAAERFGDRIDGTIKGPASSEELKAKVQEALGDAEPDALKARADKIAVEAAMALRQLAASNVDVSSALGNLTAQLDRPDNVAIPAAEAIGEGGSTAQVGALLQVLGSETASLDLKVACANAAGRIFARSGALSSQILDQLTVIATSPEADIKLRGAVARALGQATMSDDAKLKLIESLQVGPGAAPAAAADGESMDGETPADEGDEG